jgi:ABC-type microcin C transport system duplicated ATPase subunit YejF
VYFRGQDLVNLRPEPMRLMRREMQMIFQDPYASLNPRMTVRDIVGEPLMAFGAASGKQIDQRVAELLDLVKMNPDFAGRYPHEFPAGSGRGSGWRARWL